ncbi:DegT/DnrJ/EryC1/StrS aminotransferase family protein [Amylibacter sp.]|nr:DegT/DnrJ/EryC1/StrS aminotransferase family protein [Amylibacter sp.]
MTDTKKKISVPVNTPLLNGNEEKYVLDCIRTGWISSEGDYVQRFENEFSTYVGRDYGVAVSNGSAALELALKVADVGPGDEVILPTFTIMSCLAPVLRAGATPIFIDCDLDTWNMEVSQLQQCINSKTKAIIAVHIYGLPCDIEYISKVAFENNIFLIEDAAEMHGQRVNGRMCGSFGDLSIFSFYPNKHITTGEGGMLVTNSEELAQKSKWYANLCFGLGKSRYEHEDLGWNFRMTNMQAALGCAQLENIEKIILLKREIGKKYNDAFSSIQEKFQLPQKKNDYSENIYWVYGMLVRNDRLEDFMNYLASHNIGNRRFFCPLHRQPIYKKYNIDKFHQLPNSENIYRSGLYLPSGLGMTSDQQDFVIEKVLKF